MGNTCVRSKTASNSECEIKLWFLNFYTRESNKHVGMSQAGEFGLLHNDVNNSTNAVIIYF